MDPKCTGVKCKMFSSQVFVSNIHNVDGTDVRNESAGQAKGPKILHLAAAEELAAILDQDKARKLSGMYIILTQGSGDRDILTHPLFAKVRIGTGTYSPIHSLQR